jgi:hypothetical protein
MFLDSEFLNSLNYYELVRNVTESEGSSPSLRNPPVKPVLGWFSQFLSYFNSGNHSVRLTTDHSTSEI